VNNIRQIKVAHDRATDKYKVLTVKNSVAFNPGDVLCRAEVDDLCIDRRWDVTVVSLDPKLEKSK
jgi:hypothetical protein